MNINSGKNSGYRNSSEISAMINSFENCTLPLADWTSETYLTVILWNLSLNPLPEAVRLIYNGIRRYNFEHNIAPTTEKIGEKPLKFWIRKINEYLKQNRNTKPIVELVNQMIQETTGEKSVAVEINNNCYKNEDRQIFHSRQPFSMAHQTI